MLTHILNIDKEIELIREERDRAMIQYQNCTNCLVELQNLRTMQNFNTMNNEQFVDFLFSKLVQHVDIEEIDLHDDDSCDDHLQFEQLCLF